MSIQFLVAEPLALSTQGLVSDLQGLFGPLFLGIVGIVALFFSSPGRSRASCSSLCWPC